MSRIHKSLVALCLSSLAFAQYKTEPAGPPPSDLAPALSAMLQPGAKIIDPKGKTYAEVWLRTDAPMAPRTTEDQVTFTTVPQGALLGVIRFSGTGNDRRGQQLKAGTYTMRYSMFPQNGDHQGVEPQRDFALLTPAAEDTDPKSTPGFDSLVAMSRKASGTPHPAVMSIFKADRDFAPGLSQMGEHDWVLQGKIGDLPLGLILVGTTAH